MDLPKSEIVCSGSNLAENFWLERSNFSIGRAEESAMSSSHCQEELTKPTTAITAFRIMYIMFKAD